MHGSPATWNVIVIALTSYLSYRGFKDPAFFQRNLFISERVLQFREIHRLLMSGFLHAGWVHLLLNMITLYLFGSDIERAYGGTAFLVIYFSSVVGGSLVSLYLHRDQSHRALGASGGVYGVLFASIFLLPGGRIMMLPLPIAIPAWLFAVLFLLASVYGLRGQIGNVGHDAHLGGALVGLLVTTFLFPRQVFASPGLWLAVVAIAAAGLWYLVRYPPYLQTAGPLSADHWKGIWRDVSAERQYRQAAEDEQTMDALLDKVARGGLHSLSPRERKQLEGISERKKRNRRGR
jgi:membrane associated rhomboid family serine protease